MQGTLGDIFADLRALSEASGSYSESGSIGPWLTQRLQTFRGLPSAVRALQSQIHGVRDVLTGTGSLGALTRLDEAAAKLASVASEYPVVNAEVSDTVGVLLPILPKLNTGTYDGEVASVLAGSGLDIVRTLHRVNDMIAQRDDAQRDVERAVTDPSVSVDARQAAMGALAGVTVPDWVKWAVLGGIAFLVLKNVGGRRE